MLSSVKNILHDVNHKAQNSTYKEPLRIHEENTKKNHNRVLSLYVVKTRLLFSSDLLGLEIIHFQTFYAN